MYFGMHPSAFLPDLPSWRHLNVEQHIWKFFEQHFQSLIYWVTVFACLRERLWVSCLMQKTECLNRACSFLSGILPFLCGFFFFPLKSTLAIFLPLPANLSLLTTNSLFLVNFPENFSDLPNWRCKTEITGFLWFQVKRKSFSQISAF